MNVAAMVALVLTLTQAIKKFLQKALKWDMTGIYAVILSVLVSIGVVIYNAVNQGSLTWAVIWTIIVVALNANGIKLLGKSFFNRK